MRKDEGRERGTPCRGIAISRWGEERDPGRGKKNLGQKRGSEAHRRSTAQEEGRQREAVSAVGAY